MLEGLDRIDWASLEGAYGAAKHVPDMLRLLTSRRKEDHWSALDGLYAGICHQACTVYRATPPAVPFLLELAAEPRVIGRAAILELLGDIAAATGYLIAHESMAGPKERAAAEFQQEMKRERAIVTAAREAVWQGLELYLTLLWDPDPFIGVAAGGVLAKLARYADEALPAGLSGADPFGRLARALRERFRMEPDVRVRRALVPHVHALARKDPLNDSLLRDLAADEPELPVRLQGVLCLADSPDAEVPPAGLQLLAHLWRAPSGGVSYYDADMLDHDDELGDEFEEEPGDEEDEPREPASLREALHRMRAVVGRRNEGPERESHLRSLVFDALKNVGDRYPEVFLPVLRAAFEAHVRDELKIPAGLPISREDWARVREFAPRDEGRDLLCDALMPLFAPCLGLEKLWLTSGDRITDAGIRALPDFPKLRDLNVAGTKITDEGVKQLLRFPTLERLSLTHTVVSNATMASVAGLSRLVDLWAVRTEIGDEGALQLARLPALEELNLSETRIGDDGAVQLARIGSLVSLTLSETFVADRGASALARLPHLRRLELNWTAVRDGAAVGLASAPALERLNLSGTRVTDAGLERLDRSRSLRELWLFDCPGVTDAGLRRLEGMRNLKEVRVDRTSVTPEGVDRLQRALPECKVTG